MNHSVAAKADAEASICAAALAHALTGVQVAERQARDALALGQADAGHHLAMQHLHALLVQVLGVLGETLRFPPPPPALPAP